MCWLELGLVFASPARDRPPGAPELLLLLLLLLLLDPHAAMATAAATATTAVMINRYRGI
jgi:hypothetical protein